MTDDSKERALILGSMACVAVLYLALAAFGSDPMTWNEYAMAPLAVVYVEAARYVKRVARATNEH